MVIGEFLGMKKLVVITLVSSFQILSMKVFGAAGAATLEATMSALGQR